MDAMLYKIGTVARLFGLTGETLRNYERAGLITSIRDVSNGYRYYDIENIFKLMALRTLRNADLSIDEIKSVFTDISFSDIQNLISVKIKKREDILQYGHSILEQLRLLHKQFEVIDANYLKIEESPDLYLLPYREDNTLNTDHIHPNELAKWTQNLFLVQSYRGYLKKLDEIRNGEFNAAFAVSPANASLLNISTKPPVIYKSAELCVHCICRRQNGEEPFSHVKQRIQGLMISNNYSELAGTFSITAFSFQEGGAEHSYVNLYTPIFV